MTETQFAMISEWMVNGNLNKFVKAHPDADRLRLVSFRSRFHYPRFKFIDNRIISLAQRHR